MSLLDANRLVSQLPAMHSTSDVSNILAVIAAAALVTHLIFKRWEPMNVPTVLLLLFFIPLGLSALLAGQLGYFKAIALTFVSYFTTLSASIIAYRLSPFHSFARYPGPILAKTSKLWYTWQISGGRQYLYQEYLHNKYGDVVRIGPNEIMIRDVSCIIPMLGASGLPKGPNWDGRSMHAPVPPLVAERDPKRHAQRRRPWNRAFSTMSLKEFTPIIANRAQQLVDILMERHGQQVDLAEWFNFFSYDFMGDMAFGGWTEMMRDGADVEGLWNAIQQSMRTSIIFEHLPWLSYYAKKLPSVGAKLKRTRAMGFARTEQRYAHGSTTRDLFYYLSNEDNAEPVSPSRPIVISDGFLAIVAGSDTTSSALTNAVWLILQNPRVYDRLRAEVDEFYPASDNALDPKHHSKMHYLEAVIQETLRLMPPVPGGSQRAPERSKPGQLVGTHWIPKGHMVRFSVWSVHRDPRNFSYPDQFWPDRWLIADGKQESKEKLVHNPAAWIPFSYGPANCVGKNLALQEMRVVLSLLLQKLDMRFADGYDPKTYFEEYHDNGVVHVGALPVVVEKRDK